MSARESIKLNKRQQIAAYLIGQGSRPSKVAKQRQVSRETISRWRNDQAFMKQAKKSHAELLANLLFDKLALVNQCHETVSEALGTKNISISARAGIAVRNLALTGTHSNVYGGVEKRLDLLLSTDEESTEAFNNVMETLDKLAALKQVDKDITDAEYRRKVTTIMCWE